MHERDASPPELSVVIPIRDEEDGLGELSRRLRAVIDALGMSAEVVLVDDGSQDRTPEIITSLSRADRRFKVVRLSRNFGHQVAISAGLHHASGQAVVVMDGDLQDPPEVIPELIERWRDGFDVVYAVREQRRDEPRPRRMAKALYYRMLKKMADVDIPVDVGDFRLVDRRLVEIFKAMPEHNPYVRGMLSWVGFKQTGVRYTRDERHAGRSKYPLAKLVSLALDGIIGFSDLPLRLALSIGFVMSGVAFLLGVTAVATKLSGVAAVPGWASLVVVISLIGGIQLAVLGAVGLYVGRVYEEVKRRPLYLVDELHGFTPAVQLQDEAPLAGIGESRGTRQAFDDMTDGAHAGED